MPIEISHEREEILRGVGNIIYDRLSRLGGGYFVVGDGSCLLYVPDRFVNRTVSVLDKHGLNPRVVKPLEVTMQ